MADASPEIADGPAPHGAMPRPPRFVVPTQQPDVLFGICECEYEQIGAPPPSWGESRWLLIGGGAGLLWIGILWLAGAL